MWVALGFAKPVAVLKSFSTGYVPKAGLTYTGLVCFGLLALVFWLREWATSWCGVQWQWHV